MEIKVLPDKEELGKEAAHRAAGILRASLEKKTECCFVAATGASQFEFLDHLTNQEGIEWDRTVMFHLDEYIGLDDQHPASFRRYLRERLIESVNPGAVHLIQGDADDPHLECERLNSILGAEEVDVAFVGIGENGHLAFNDPPADFEVQDPYIIVELDEACRRQQLGEGWFGSLSEVPTQAISMSVSAIMKANHIICCVPDERKAQAVRNCLSADSLISNDYPASILKNHPNAWAYLDPDSSRLLEY